MRFAVLDDFKSARTLLVWGAGEDLRPLVAAFDALAEGARTSVSLDLSLGAEAADRSRVSIEAAREDRVILSETEGGPAVQLLCSKGRFAQLADQLRSLTTVSGAGHHYLYISPDQPLQIIVSAGEYPPEMHVC